jgi:hypothetical protein
VRVQGCSMGSRPFSKNHVNVWNVEVEMESMIGDDPWALVMDLRSLGWYR